MDEWLSGMHHMTKSIVKMATIGMTAVALCGALCAAEAERAPESVSNPKGRLALACEPPTLDAEPLAIGSRRELFVDNYIIGAIKGSAVRHLFEMTPATTGREDVAMIWNADWEGSWCRYSTFIQEPDGIKAWYMGAQHLKPGDKSNLRMCYATSKDGITFVKPELGLFDWSGSKKNNVLFSDLTFSRPGSLIAHNFAPFIDTNPAAPPEARYKAVSGYGLNLGRGLFVFQSPDGIDWTLREDHPTLTQGLFDSMNRAFWDEVQKRYALYFRYWRNENGEEGLSAKGRTRDIMVCFSDDFITWSKPQWLVYHRNDGEPGMKLEQLYTNEIKPYKRAPHLYFGFPARYLGRVEPMFMASRDGVHFYRWMDHPLIPRTAPADRDKNRSNHIWQEMVEIAGEPNTYSMYASENLGIDGPHPDGSFPRVRRFTIRKDGFVSVRAEGAEGELLTKPLTFSGRRLTVNVNAKLHEGGHVLVEMLDEQLRPIPGFKAAECDRLSGDATDAPVAWNGKTDLGALEGKVVHLRFVLRNADLFSFKFGEIAP